MPIFSVICLGLVLCTFVMYKQSRHEVELEDSFEVIAANLDDSPASATDNYNLGIDCFKKTHFDLAIQSFSKAIKGYEKILFWETGPYEFANAYYLLGLSYKEKQNWEKAIEAFHSAIPLFEQVRTLEKTVKRKIDMPTANFMLGECYCEIAHSLLEQHRMYLNEMNSLKNTSSTSSKEIAMGEKNDLLRQSIEYCNKSLIYNSKNAQTYLVLGTAHDYGFDYTKAIESFSKALSFDHPAKEIIETQIAISQAKQDSWLGQIKQHRE